MTKLVVCHYLSKWPVHTYECFLIYASVVRMTLFFSGSQKAHDHHKYSEHYLVCMLKDKFGSFQVYLDMLSLYWHTTKFPKRCVSTHCFIYISWWHIKVMSCWMGSCSRKLWLGVSGLSRRCVRKHLHEAEPFSTSPVCAALSCESLGWHLNVILRFHSQWTAACRASVCVNGWGGCNNALSS